MSSSQVCIFECIDGIVNSVRWNVDDTIEIHFEMLFSTTLARAFPKPKGWRRETFGR